jgi:hypothetical protein
MPKITVIFGFALIFLGLFAYFVWGNQSSITALAPSFAGVIFVVLGLLAFKEKFLKHSMHMAALVGVLLFFGSFGGLLRLPTLLAGGEVARPLAVQVQSVTAILSLLFVILCVADFIRIRKARKSLASS